MDSCIPKITQILHWVFYAIFLLTKSFLMAHGENWSTLQNIWHCNHINHCSHDLPGMVNPGKIFLTWKVATSVEGDGGGFGEKKNKKD